jgi:hypothetical protein
MKHTVLQALTVLALAFAVVMTVRIIAARAGETPIYGPDGKYQGSVHHLVVRRTLEMDDAQA